MLNISHTKNTLVGDEFVRGVSGGERKRVSIAEMMATRARVQCWDNSTRGLDASTALDFVKSLRIMTDVLGQTTFVTLYVPVLVRFPRIADEDIPSYQAGEGIYDLFDKVMVLNKGRQVFFGPPTEARAYFENLGYKPLPRQSTPDYLTGCTDPNERQFAPGRSSKDVPSNPEALEYAFRQSSFGRELEQSRESYKLYQETDRADQEAFREAVAKDKKKGVSRKSPYTLGFFGQVKAITVRQFQQKKQDTFFLTTSFSLSTILALVIGGAYFSKFSLLLNYALTNRESTRSTIYGCRCFHSWKCNLHCTACYMLGRFWRDACHDDGPAYSEKADKLPSLPPRCNRASKHSCRPSLLRDSYPPLQHHRLLHD